MITVTNTAVSNSGIGNFQPDRLPGCEIWLDASDSSSVTLNGSDVSQIDDKSGNFNHATQGTAVNQPAYTDSVNDLNVMTFNGSSEYLETINNLSIDGNDVRIVFIAGLLSANESSFLSIGSGAANGLFYISSYSNKWFLGGYGTGNDYDTGVNYDSNFNIHTVTHNATIAQWYRNGSQLGAGFTHTYATVAEPLTVGVRNKGGGSYDFWLNGKIGEIIIYNRFLSAAEILIVQNYLNVKWGI